jgi:hypothetical protein
MAGKLTKWTTPSIVRHSKIYPNWDFWFENLPSGNHVDISSNFISALLLSMSGRMPPNSSSARQLQHGDQIGRFFFFGQIF